MGLLRQTILYNLKCLREVVLRKRVAKPLTRPENFSDLFVLLGLNRSKAKLSAIANALKFPLQHHDLSFEVFSF